MKLGMLGMHHSHAPGIVRQVAAHPDEFELVAFHDPEESVVSERAREWGPLLPSFRTYASADEFLSVDLDGVVVEGRVWDNLKWARLALESGRPVLLEKPAGTDMEEFASLVALAKQKRLHLQMLYLFRYMSAVVEMRSQARSGALGDIYEFRGRLPKELENYSDNTASFDWHPGGIFFEMAGHLIDMMVTLLGTPHGVTPFMNHHHSTPGDFIDNGVAVVEFDRGLGVVEVPALEVAPKARRIEVYGTRGACVIPNLGSGHLANDATQPVDVYHEGESEWKRLPLPAATLQVADLREFVACVRGERDPEFTKDHDLCVQETLLRACGTLGGEGAKGNTDTDADTRSER